MIQPIVVRNQLLQSRSVRALHIYALLLLIEKRAASAIVIRPTGRTIHLSAICFFQLLFLPVIGTITAFPARIAVTVRFYCFTDLFFTGNLDKILTAERARPTCNIAVKKSRQNRNNYLECNFSFHFRTNSPIFFF